MVYDLPNGYKGHIRYYCSTNSIRVHFEINIPYGAERVCYPGHEDLRRPENRNPLREVAVNLLAS